MLPFAIPQLVRRLRRRGSCRNHAQDATNWRKSQPETRVFWLTLTKPRLHKKRRRTDESGEVEVPAYTALQSDQRLADRMLELVLNGVSTRRYEKVLPAMADQVGISKSEVSRETIEAGTRVLQELAEQDLSASWTYWWSTSTGSCSGTTTCWRRLASMRPAREARWASVSSDPRAGRQDPVTSKEEATICHRSRR